MLQLTPSRLVRTPTRVSMTQRLSRTVRLSCRASGDSADAAPQQMSYEQALRRLGLSATEASNFEAILDAKNKQMAASGSDQERQMEVETAYDVLFMQSMKQRISAPSQVPSSVRFADVQAAKKRGGQRARAAPSPSLLQRLPGGGISLEQPKQGVAAGQAAVFGGLVVWALLQAVLESPDAQAADTAGVQLAAALAFSVYGLREWRRLPLGRAIGLSLGAMAIGIVLGAGVNAWLRVDIVPVGSFGSPGVLVSTFGIAMLALASAFLA